MTDEEPDIPDYGQAPRDIVPPTAAPALYRKLADHDGQPVTLTTGVVHEDVNGLPTAVTPLRLHGTLHIPCLSLDVDDDQKPG